MTEKHVDMTPSWQTAATIISMVLENPDARMTSKDDARKELMQMAALLDKLIKSGGRLMATGIHRRPAQTGNQRRKPDDDRRRNSGSVHQNSAGHVRHRKPARVFRGYDDVALDDDGNFKLLDFDLDRWREDHARKYTVMVETEPDVVGPDSHFEDIWSARRHAHSLASGSAIDVYIDCFTKTYIEGNVEWIYEYHEDVTVNPTSTRAYISNLSD